MASTGLMNFEVNLTPFREPRGFIKILQWIFAILAFSTTVSFSTQFGFDIKCPMDNNVTTHRIQQIVEYPFELDHDSLIVPLTCVKPQSPAPTPLEISFLGNARSDAQYFVCTGVLSFLYAMIAGTLYLLYEKVYQTNNKVPLIDFCVTLVLAIFWISGVAAFSKGVSTMSSATDPNVVWKYNSVTHHHDHDGSFPTGLPPGFNWGYASFSKLVVSILFGVINFVLWTGNLWFLYKETTWFESIVKHSGGMGPNSNI